MFGLHQDQSGPIPRGVWRQSTSALRYGCFMMFHECPAMIPRRQCLMLTHGAHDFLVVSLQGVSRCLIPRWMRQTFIHWRHCILQQHREVPISIFVTIPDPNWENQRDQKVKLKSLKDHKTKQVTFTDLPWQGYRCCRYLVKAQADVKQKASHCASFAVHGLVVMKFNEM